MKDSLKGSLLEGTHIKVSLPGGMVRFEDGTTAEVRTPWFKKMETGDTYVLLLTKAANGGGFMPTGGPQGVYELPANGGMIKTHSGRLHDPIGKYHNLNVQAFLNEVRRAIKKESKS